MASGPSFRSGSATATGTTDLTIVKPTGTIENDLMVMTLAHKGADWAVMPVGWTLIAHEITADGTRGEMYWKRAGGAEPGSYNVTGLATVARGFIMSYEGMLLSGDPINVVSSRVNASATGWPYTDEITTTVEDAIIIDAVIRGGSAATGGRAELHNDGTPAELKKPWVTRQTIASNSATISMLYHDTLWSVPGNAGSSVRTTVESLATESIGIIVAVKPEPVDYSAVNRFYATKRNLGTFLEGPLDGDWAAGESTRDKRGRPHWTFVLSPTRAGGGSCGTVSGATNRFTFGDVSHVGPIDSIPAYRFVTPRLKAQTLGGTLQICFNAHPSTFNPETETKFKVHAYITDGDSLVKKATILDNFVDSVVWENISQNYKSLASAQSLAAEAIADGDRIVVEIGGQCELISATTNPFNQYFLNFGTATQDGQVPTTDAATSVSLGAVRASWVHFSQALDCYTDREGNPSNTTAAAATVIASLPYAIGPVDCSGSLGYHRAIWFTWTAPSDMRVVLSTFGGNASVRITVWKTASPTLVSERVNELNGGRPVEEAWIGRSQATHTFDAVNGQQYWIELRSRGYQGTVTNTSQFAADDEGGAVRFTMGQASAETVDDDIIVSSQYLAQFRDGVLVNIQGAAYDTTPTGSVQDRSGRTIDSVNGGTHSGPRLLVGEFGAGTVNIFDLDDLGVGHTFANEDFIFDALYGGAEFSVHPASLVMDRAGNVYVGYFGDNYSALGTPPDDPATAAITVVDATHGDSQSGAPWPIGTRYEVELENSGTDFIELAVDQDTMFYTSAGRKIFRFALGTQTQLANFAELAPESGARPGLRGLRLLPPGDGSTGLIVADGINVKRLNSSGAVVQTYTPTSSSGVAPEDLDKVELSADGTTFWVSDQWSGEMFKFNISTGAQLDSLSSGLPPGQTCGFSAFSSYRAGEAEEEDAQQEAIQDLATPCPCADTPTTGKGPDPIGPLPAPTFDCPGGGQVEMNLDLAGLEPGWAA